MIRLFVIQAGIAVSLLAHGVQAALIVNAPRQITDRISVNLISVADDNGANSTAGMLGTTAQRAQVFSLVDTVFAQAGVDVEFAFRAGTYNSTFARLGAVGKRNPRPSTDLRTLYQAAAAAGGVLSTNTNTINLFLVSIVPGFSQFSTGSAAGIATVGGNGIAYYGGSALSTYSGGREVLASVLSHEIGHNLGLSHNTTAENLMQSGGGGEGGERLNSGQISTILASRFTVPIPAPTQDGDFTGDKRVDGADFLAWQRGLSPRPLSGGDLGLWEGNFGEAIGAVTHSESMVQAVPEPGAAVLGLACFSFAAFASRRSRTAARGES